MNRKEYNGWYNYETWCVNLWLTNEESSANYWCEAAQLSFRHAIIKHESYFTISEQARLDLAKQLKDEIEETAPDLGASMWTDMLNASLSEVNWNEIANGFLEEVEDGEDKYESVAD